MKMWEQQTIKFTREKISDGSGHRLRSVMPLPRTPEIYDSYRPLHLFYT